MLLNLSPPLARFSFSVLFYSSSFWKLLDSTQKYSRIIKENWDYEKNHSSFFFIFKKRVLWHDYETLLFQNFSHQNLRQNKPSFVLIDLSQHWLVKPSHVGCPNKVVYMVGWLSQKIFFLKMFTFFFLLLFHSLLILNVNKNILRSILDWEYWISDNP